MADEGVMAVCPMCKRPRRTVIPKGGDGSVSVFYHHEDAGTGEPCPGGRREVPDDAWIAPDERRGTA